MNTHTQPRGDDLTQIVEYARALLAATSDVADEKVAEARSCLAAAIDRGHSLHDRVRDHAAAGAKAVNTAVHHHPYQAVGMSLGLGALVGFLITREFGRRGS